MNYKELDAQINEGIYKKMYLFFGTEKYLHSFYLNKIKEEILKSGLQEMNYLMLQSENITIGKIADFCESYPLMSDKKLLIIKDCRLLEGKSNDDIDPLKEILDNVPDYVHVIFSQDDINKKTSLYMYLQKNACCIDFEKLGSSDLVKWCANQVKKENKKIDTNAAQYLVEILDGDMNSIKNECQKLAGFIGDRDIITLKDINAICQKTLNYSVFEMVDNTVSKQLDSAIMKLNEILNSKEPEVKILGLIIWNLNTLLKVKLADSEGMPPNLISKSFEIGFINKYMKQINRFSIFDLENALIKCAKADNDMKSNGLDNKVILEKLIIEIGS